MLASRFADGGIIGAAKDCWRGSLVPWRDNRGERQGVANVTRKRHKKSPALGPGSSREGTFLWVRSYSFARKRQARKKPMPAPRAKIAHIRKAVSANCVAHAVSREGTSIFRVPFRKKPGAGAEQVFLRWFCSQRPHRSGLPAIRVVQDRQKDYRRRPPWRPTARLPPRSAYRTCRQCRLH